MLYIASNLLFALSAARRLLIAQLKANKLLVIPLISVDLYLSALAGSTLTGGRACIWWPCITVALEQRGHVHCIQYLLTPAEHLAPASP